MKDNPLSQNFGGTISDREELEELMEKVDAFAGTLTEEFQGEIRVEFTVSPVLDIEEDDGN